MLRCVLRPPQLAASLILERVAGAMSAIGTKRTSACALQMSAFGTKRTCESHKSTGRECIRRNGSGGAFYWFLASGYTGFDLDLSVQASTFKIAKTRVGTCSRPFRHPACQLRQMWRAAVRAGSVRILRRAQRASPLEMRALRLLF